MPGKDGDRCSAGSTSGASTFFDGGSSRSNSADSTLSGGSSFSHAPGATSFRGSAAGADSVAEVVAVAESASTVDMLAPVTHRTASPPVPCLKSAD